MKYHGRMKREKKSTKLKRDFNRDLYNNDGGAKVYEASRDCLNKREKV